MNASTSRSASVTMSASADFVAAIATPSDRRSRASSPASRAISTASSFQILCERHGPTLSARRASGRAGRHGASVGG